MKKRFITRKSRKRFTNLKIIVVLLLFIFSLVLSFCLLNRSNIKINDNVSSMHGMCIGKVVNIIYEDLESIIVVKMGSVNNLNYVGVIER